MPPLMLLMSGISWDFDVAMKIRCVVVGWAGFKKALCSMRNKAIFAGRDGLLYLFGVLLRVALPCLWVFREFLKIVRLLIDGCK